MEKEQLYVILTGVLSGLIVFGGQIFLNMGLSIYQILVFIPLFVFLLLPFVILKKECHIKKEMLGFFAVFGFISTVVNFGEFAPLIFGVPVAVVVILLYTQPLWTTILSKLFLKEEITKYKILSIALVLIGVIILINPFSIRDVGQIPGVILALVGGIALSGWVISGRIAGKKNYHPITSTFLLAFFILVFILLLYPIISIFIKDPAIMNLSFDVSPQIWFYILVFVIIARIAPNLLYFYGAKKVRASDAGVILLLEPVSAAVLAAVLLNQPLTWNIIIGGALILLSNYIVIKFAESK